MQTVTKVIFSLQYAKKTQKCTGCPNTIGRYFDIRGEQVRETARQRVANSHGEC